MATMLAIAPAADGAQPMDTFKKSVEDGLRILNDPGYRSADRKAVQLLRLRQVLYREFDFKEFSRRVLADKWNLFTAPQRTEFVSVFSRFLSDHYLARLQEYYRNEKVILLRQDLIAPDRAVVQSTVTWRNLEIPVELRMHARDGNWKVYDVIVMGISAVQAYRTQLQEILRTRSPAEVIDLIRQRLEEF